MSVAGWRPTIGDPSLLGWFTVFAYAAAALLCLGAMRSSRPDERRFWLIAASLLAFLCLNKELDLQSLFTALLRDHAMTHGWYEMRRELQKLFILVMLAVWLVVIVVAARMFRRQSTGARIAVAGLASLGAFILIRASSFHHVDGALGVDRGIFNVNLLELGGIAITAGGALWSARRP